MRPRDWPAADAGNWVTGQRQAAQRRDGCPGRIRPCAPASGRRASFHRGHDRGARTRSTGDLSGLSDREREIANLIAGGATNPDIAGTLFLSRKTVERHVSSILGKLEVKNRAQLAARIAAGDGGREHRAAELTRRDDA